MSMYLTPDFLIHFYKHSTDALKESCEGKYKNVGRDHHGIAFRFVRLSKGDVRRIRRIINKIPDQDVYCIATEAKAKRADQRYYTRPDPVDYQIYDLFRSRWKRKVGPEPSGTVNQYVRKVCKHIDRKDLLEY